MKLSIYDPEQWPDHGDLSCAKLARAILRQAIREAHGIVLSGELANREELRQEALHYVLKPSEGLDFWCRVAGVHMEAFLQKAQQELGG